MVAVLSSVHFIRRENLSSHENVDFETPMTSSRKEKKTMKLEGPCRHTLLRCRALPISCQTIRVRVKSI